MPEHTWKSFLGLSRLGEADPLFQDLGAKFVMLAEEWADWYQSPCPEEDSLPGDFARAGELETLCVLRVLRPDRITSTLRNVVARFLGEEFVSQPPFSISNVYKDSSASTPILFPLFPGVDPAACVENFAREMGINSHNGLFSNISMGERSYFPSTVGYKSSYLHEIVSTRSYSPPLKWYLFFRPGPGG